MTVQMEKMMKMMKQDFPKSKRLLEINTNHPINQNLSKILQINKTNEFLKKSVDQLFNNALIVEGLLENPAEVLPKINEFINDATSYQLNEITKSNLKK